MRLATVFDGDWLRVVYVRDGRFLPMDPSGPGSLRSIAGSAWSVDRARRWVDAQPQPAWRPLEAVTFGPSVQDPGAIYAIGLNYRPSGERDDGRFERPLVYGKLPTSVAGHGATLDWDRTLTPNVDAEVELGLVIGKPATAVNPKEALDHVFGYTIVNDISSRDPWLDGDQWLLGKSIAGFCPVGPWVVTRDELAPQDLRLGCTVNGVPIQDGSTAQMRFSIADVISYLSRHVTLLPGDLIATGTPARLATPPGPERHLQPGDVVTAWIEGIGELTTTVA
jgi:2-keto-4-pentenoate hydratase/2-oxohepta-3-ene-1,7-dioic acid hydratase in catechol pathway